MSGNGFGVWLAAGTIAVSGGVIAASGPADAVGAARSDRSTGDQAGATFRASLGPHSRQGNSDSGAAKVSGNGKRIAFGSAASNLVAGDTNHRVDVFVRDRPSHQTLLVTVGRHGAAANGDSRVNGVSRTGRYLAYDSSASNLVPGDTNDRYDVFVRDLTKTSSERVSVSTSGAQANAESFRPAISATGRYVAFDSYSTNLVAGDTNGGFDVFLRDRVLGTTERVSVGPGGVQANGESTSAAISSDGRYIVYESGASNLVAGDDNGQVDVFRYDRETGITEMASAAADGGAADESSFIADISGSGRYVVFTSKASDLVDGDTNGLADVFVRDMVTHTTVRVSVATEGTQADDVSLYGTISDDGSIVTFDSSADNLVAGDTNGNSDIFARDLVSGVTTRVSVSSAGAQGNLGSVASSISDNGRYVAFTSAATTLVDGDTNGHADVFAHQLR